MPSTLLIVDDEESICRNLKSYFVEKGYTIFSSQSGMSAIDLVGNTLVDLVLLDLRLPDMDGLKVLETIKDISPGTGVIMITAHGDVETAVRAMQLKADNFILKPLDLTALETMVSKSLDSCRTGAEIQYLRRKISNLDGSEHFRFVRQPPEVYHAVQLLANNPSTNVLLLGETGTGKGVVAKIIHELSERRSGQFVDINCAGLSGELLESELFGHEKGAFTDAKNFKRGLLEVANEGSLFLDEVGELSLSVQAKLLKVIEERQFRRLGGTANIEVNVRIMAATNSELEQAVRRGSFRKDLFYRLNVMPVNLPPLRKRSDDILPLAGNFLNEFRMLFGKKVNGFSPTAESMILSYSWPGNIRELRNVVERAVLLCDDDIIHKDHLPENLKGARIPPDHYDENSVTKLEELEKTHIQSVLKICNGNHSQASRLLGIHRSTLIRKLKSYRLND